MDIARYLRNMVQLIFSPARGWEDIEAEEAGWDSAVAEERASAMFRRCFLPVAGVCAVSRFVRLLYGDEGGVLAVVQEAIVAFVSLFLAAQFARWAMQIAMPKILGEAAGPHCSAVDVSESVRRRARMLELICYSLTFLGLVEFLGNVIKVRIALLAFLPIYVVFIIWQGSGYLRVPSRSVLQYVVTATMAIAGSAYVISFLLNAVI